MNEITTTPVVRRIYWLTVYLDEVIHVQALGFTRHFYVYAYATSPEEAKLLAHAYVLGKGLKFNRIPSEPRLSEKPDVRRYAFVEQILGVTPDHIRESYTVLGLLGTWLEDALKEHANRAQAITKGLEMLTPQASASAEKAHA